jgi:hypothetical protein
MKLRKYQILKKNFAKNQSQPVLIYETCDLCHEFTIEVKP